MVCRMSTGSIDPLWPLQLCLQKSISTCIQRHLKVNYEDGCHSNTHPAGFLHLCAYHSQLHPWYVGSIDLDLTLKIMSGYSLSTWLIQGHPKVNYDDSCFLQSQVQLVVLNFKIILYYEDLAAHFTDLMVGLIAKSLQGVPTSSYVLCGRK